MLQGRGGIIAEDQSVKVVLHAWAGRHDDFNPCKAYNICQGGGPFHGQCTFDMGYICIREMSLR